MKKDFIYVSPCDDQENVANIVAQYNYLAISVIDDNKLIGIITAAVFGFLIYFLVTSNILNV